MIILGGRGRDAGGWGGAGVLVFWLRWRGGAGLGSWKEGVWGKG